MISSETAFMPLYFEEAEADLWQALQQIEPAKRSAFIKAALRQALFGENRAEEIQEDITLINKTKNNNDQEQAKDYVDTLEGEIESFSLEALFSGTFEPDLTCEVLNEQEKTPPNSLQEPWDYLLHEVIGEEEDLVVIKAILQAVNSSKEQFDNIPMETNSSGHLTDEVDGADDSDGQFDIVMDKEFEVDFESLKVDIPQSMAGFEYLMNQIIGSEEDEAVLKVLRSSRREDQTSD